MGLLLPVAAVAFAASPEPPGPAQRAMSLRAAIEYALSHQVEVIAARERLRAIRAASEVPSSQWEPTVGLVAQWGGGTTNNSTTASLPTSLVDLPRIGGTSVRASPLWKPYASSLVSLGVQQELFDFGKIAAQTAAATALVALQEDRLRGVRLDAVLAVTEAYYAVRAAHALLQVATEAEGRSRIHRDYADEAVRAGLRPAIERTRAEADVARFEVNRIRAAGNLQVAESTFAATVGFPGAELDARPEEFQVAALPPRLDVHARARDADPRVRESISRARAQHLRTVSMAASKRPTLYATGAISGRAGGAPASDGVVPTGHGLLPEVPNYGAALVLEWPLFEPMNRAEVRASREQERALLAEVDVARQAAVTQAEQAYRNGEAALASLEALTRSADAARDNHEQAEARFRSGLGTSTELADAEMLRVDAEIQLAIGQFQLAIARAIIARTMTEEP